MRTDGKLDPSMRLAVTRVTLAVTGRIAGRSVTPPRARVQAQRLALHRAVVPA